MSRYRPPSTPSSPYITPDGHGRLSSELDYLWRVKRPEVTKALTAAAAEGDRSENAEYIYRKKELREIDRRVRFLQKRLPTLKIVREKPDDTSRVFFGASVLLEDDQGGQVRYRIVGPDEFDSALGWISLDSPMARALLKKALDDRVSIQTPNGGKEYDVVEITY